jgi:hypothetical protein
MGAREEAEQLRQQAIAKLLGERDAIDEQLKLLGYGHDAKTPAKRRGRPPKQVTLEDAGERANVIDGRAESGAVITSE